jgi:hypothetical protein
VSQRSLNKRNHLGRGVFTKNRERLLEAEGAKEFLARVVAQARTKGWTSDERFTAG